MAGTNFFAPVGTGVKGPLVLISQTDEVGNAVLGKSLVADIPSQVAGYAVGCLWIATDTGALYTNTGTALLASFANVNSDAFTLPTSIADASSTTGNSLALSPSALTTGTGLLVTGATANFTTGGALFKGNLTAAIAGQAFSGVTTGIYTGTGLLLLTANAATTGIIANISCTGLSTGNGLLVTGGTAMSTGSLAYLNMGAATAGYGLKVATTGIYNDTSGLINVTANSAATPTGLVQISATGITTGNIIKAIATAATLTTGRYLSFNDTTNGEVFGIGTNGHIISTAGTVPTIATNSTGISACAITSGGTDTCGVVTTTGTPQSGTVLTITFGKTYTTAPKCVTYTPTNAAAGGVNTMPIVTTTATTAVFTWPAAGAYAATPSFMYSVIA